MRHLSEAEFVDLLDGRLDTDRTAHVESCDECRERADALGAILGVARRDEVPEPAPVFWRQLSERVSEGIQAESRANRWRRLLVPGRVRLAAAAVVLLIVGGVTWQLLTPRDWQMRIGSIPADGGSREPRTNPDAVDSVDAWDLLEAMAQDLEWEDAESIGIGSGPGATDRMLGDLSVEERDELGRLIEEEIRRHGA